jgi:hypothetical protein
MNRRGVYHDAEAYKGMNWRPSFESKSVRRINPYSEDPKYDLDTPSSTLVKYHEDGRHGSTYPDMSWEPKESFRALAEYYGRG